jgi:hypothetical protein
VLAALLCSLVLAGSAAASPRSAPVAATAGAPHAKGVAARAHGRSLRAARRGRRVR